MEPLIPYWALGVLKGCVIAAFLIVLGFGIKLVALGRGFRNDPYTMRYGVRQRKHRRTAKLTLYWLITAIVLTEAYVRFASKIEAPVLFPVHLFGFALPFFLTFLAAMRWNGERAPRIHPKLVYTCVVLFVGTLGTGGFLLFQ